MEAASRGQGRPDLGGTLRRWVHQARAAVDFVVAQCEAVLQRHTWMCVGLLVLAYLPLVVVLAHARQLTSDELYTWKIAQQPTLHGMVQLSRAIDLHPPLHFLLQRASLSLGLPRWLGSRLPSLVAGQVGLLVVFWYFARRFGNLAGMLAATAYWMTPATDYAFSNRPYALWLCLLAVSAYLWERAGESGRRWWVPLGLLLAGLAMVLDYMFGLACLMPLLAAEGVRAYRRRRWDWAVIAALVAPCVAGATYFEQMSSFATNMFSPVYLASFPKGIDMYVDLTVVAVAVTTACVYFSRMMRAQAEAPAVRFPAEEWVLAALLFALPALLLLAAGLHHTQFFPRYGACGAVGLGLLLPMLLLRWWARSSMVAVWMIVAMLSISYVRLQNDTVDWEGPWRATEAMGVSPVHLEALDPALPIVVASAVEFTEMNDREPRALAQRFYYLVDRDLAEQFSGQTIFETEDQTARMLGLPGHSEPAAAFFAAHRHFYLVGSYLNQEQWVMRYLMANGATLEYKGKYVSQTLSDDLYVVTLRGQ